jgi:DNA invertase Pin-like site-specific DNA recombinase
MNAAAYVRVSSRSQSLATQRDAIERAARARGDRITRWFSETQSAVRIDRGELGNVRAAVRAGNVRRLYLYRLDRLSRSGIRDTLHVLEELRAGGCEVLSVADGFSLDGPAADVVIAVIAWAAQMERAAIGERIAAARQRIQAAGGAWGRPRRVSEPKVKEIRQRAKAGETIRELAVALKVPRSTVAEVVSGKGPYAELANGRKKRVRASVSE